MPHSRRLAWLLALVAYAPSAFAGDEPVAMPARNWAQAPAIVDIKTDGEIYVIGDGHGDYARFAELLVRAGLIRKVPDDPTTAEWTGGTATLVCTGDLIDKAPKEQRGGSLKLVRLMRRLAKTAPGRVILTMGNHEATFLAYPGNKKVKDFVTDLADARIAIDSVTKAAGCTGEGTEGCQLGAFLRQLPFGARVNGWFFSHAGNSGGRSLDDLKRTLASTVDQARSLAPLIDDPNSILEARLCAEDKRDSDDEEDDAGKPGDKSCSWWGPDPKETLTRNARALPADHIVQGHQAGPVSFPSNRQRSKGALFQKFGLIFLIDGGMSRNPKVNRSAGGVLRIYKDKQVTKAEVLCRDKKHGQLLWSEDAKDKLEDEVRCK